MTTPRHLGYQRRRALRLATEAANAEARRSCAAAIAAALLDVQGPVTPLPLLTDVPWLVDQPVARPADEPQASADADGQAHLLRSGPH